MNAANDILIEAKDVSLKFDARAGIEHVTIAIRAGEIVTLIGPNGAGKSTLVRILLGLLRPDSGEVQRKSDLRVGYVPQNLAADPAMPMTVTRFLRMAAPVNDKIVGDILAEVGADALAEAALEDLSGGELQRVHLARALLREPDLMVLDEPTQNVDFSGQAELFSLIAELRDRRRCGVLIISHDLHLVMSKTDHVLCLNQHVCCEGQPEAVSRHPEYQALFGPQVADGLAVYSHHHDHHHGLSGEVEHGHDHARDHGGHRHSHND